MTVSDTRRAEIGAVPGLGFQWGPIIAGAIAAAALAFVLDTFGLAIGLAVSSAAPTWRDTSFTGHMGSVDTLLAACERRSR